MTITGGKWYPVDTLADLLSRDPALCGRPTKNETPCRSHRLVAVTVECDGTTMRYEALACRSHATEAELAEHASVTELAGQQRLESCWGLPVACWSWPVTDEHRRRAAAAVGCPDEDEAHALAMGLLDDWQDRRCAVCGGRAEFTDHDHETGLVRGLLCQSCNTLEGFASVPGGRFDRYRERNPASILGVKIRYYSPFTGWAEPEPPPIPLDGHAAYVLGTRYGVRRDA